LSQISLPWQPGSLLLKFDWYHWIASPWEPPVRRKHLGDISYTRRVIRDYVLNFVAMVTGLVVVQFVWHHSIAHPWIPPTRCKWHRDIFYTSRVIAYFVLNFVVMATRVGPLKIWLTSFDRLFMEPPVRCKHLRDISYMRRVIGDVILNSIAMEMGFVVAEFVWHHSIAHSRIPLTRHKRHHDIFYTSRVCFVSIFVAMASRSLYNLIHIIW